MNLFDNILGQDFPKLILEKAIRKNRLPSAFLFLGPGGVGKKTTALTLAKVLNCKKGGIGEIFNTPNSEFKACGVCPACKKIDGGNHPDVRIIEPEIKGKKDIPIAAVRDLRREVTLKPFEGNKRIFLVLHADRMTPEASNAFLKTLEEPPLDTLLILTSTRPNFLLSTILSRCQKIRFRRLTSNDIERFLLDKCSVSEENSVLLSRLSGGSLGFALNLINEEYIEARKSFSLFFFQLPKMSHLDVLDFVEDQGSEETLRFLFSFYRDLLLLKIGTSLKPATTKRDENGMEMIDNPDYITQLKDFTDSLSLEQILSRIGELETGWNALRRNVNTNLILSTILFQHLKSN
jgi:DNA polymerase-3 subunit delta'